MLTQDRLRQVLAYDPDTGLFTFVKGRRAGRVAGTPHDDRGFLKVAIDGRNHLLHRLAWLWMTGTHPRWNIVHINGDRSDNRWSNLREGARGQKAQYRASWREPTKVQGVWQVGDIYEAMVEIEGQVINLGAFPTIDKAADAIKELWERARARHHFQRPRAA